MPHVELPQAEFKVVILGDSHIGKTSLVTRFAEGYYRENSRPATIGAFFVTKRIQSTDNVPTKIQIWDTAGAESFRAMAPMFYGKAAAVVVCYDATRRETFEGMRGWLDEVRRKVRVGDEVVVAIAALKTDLVREGGPHAAAVPEAEVASLAEALGVLYLPTSAKTDTNVHALFKCVADRVLRLRRDAGATHGEGAPGDCGAAASACGQRDGEGHGGHHAAGVRPAEDGLHSMASPRKRDEFDRYYISNNVNATNIEGNRNGHGNHPQPGNGSSAANGNEESMPTETSRGSNHHGGRNKTFSTNTSNTASTSNTDDCTEATEDSGHPLFPKTKKNGESKESPVLEEPNFICQAMTCGAVGEGNGGCTVQ